MGKKVFHFCNVEIRILIVSMMLIFVVGLFFKVSQAYAESPTVNSQNYQVTGQFDFAGQASNSQNYSVSGILTDIKDVSIEAQTENNAPVNKISESPSPSPTPTGESGNSIKSLLDNSLLKKLAGLLDALALILGLMNLLMPLLFNLPWLNLGSSTWSGLMSLIGWIKKKKQWGIVYDSESGQPIPLATVNIYDFNEHKLLETQLTNNEGRFGFLVGAGNYYLQAIKTNYTYPSNLTDKDYHGREIEIKEDSLLNINVPMDPDMPKLMSSLKIIAVLNDIIQAIRIPVLVLGTIFAVLFFYISPSWFNSIVVMMYVILWGIEIYNYRRTRSFGIVADLDDKTPIHLAIVRILERESNKLIATRVSGPKGYYYYIINPGEYSLVTTKEGFDQFKIASLIFKKGDVLGQDILLKKKSSS